ncbi:MAG TPA: hypothetical protein VFT12_01150, partial [Thermoanaerobaculia bacterium]|nr:hypothetical protein [Thermoanaerobaculia bacterium]
MTFSLFAHGTLRFDNGRWYDGSRFVQRTMWSVDGVFRDSFDGAPDSVVDLAGGWVIPPFGDAHHHAFGGGDPARDILRFLSAGIFYVKNPNNQRSLAAPIRPKVNLPESVDVIYSNGGLTATGGHPSPIYGPGLEGDAYFFVDDEASLARTWPQVLAGQPDFLKIYLEDSGTPKNRGLDPKLVPSIVKRAHAAGLTVSAHVTSAADFRIAVAAGVDEINHLPLEKLTSDDASRAAAKKTRVVTTTISHRDTSRVKDLDALHRENLQLLHNHGVG